MKIPTLLALCTLAFSAQAQMSPLGLWRNIDDVTGQAKAEIRITQKGAGLSGVVEKSLVPPDPKADPNCNLCTDDRKGQPKVGLEIIRGGAKAAGKDSWEGGRILDPENGKDYSLRLTPIEGGKKLEVRGYLGLPMLGRSQTWIRIE